MNQTEPFKPIEKQRPLTRFEQNLRQKKGWLALEKFWQDHQEPLAMWFGFRVALLILPMFLATLFPMATHGLVRGLYSNAALDRAIGSWTRWDGVIYLDIATRGYDDPALISFYPLYPHLMRGVAFIFTFSTDYLALGIAGILISSLATLALCLLMYKLARLEYNTEVARLSLLYLLVFPTAFFMWAVYTESLFLALAVGAFYAARTNRWFLALLLTSASVLTKNQGVFVALALAVEYGQQINWSPRKLDHRFFYFFLPVLAFGFWLGTNWAIFNNPLQFIKSQANFNRQFAFPWETLIRAVGTYEFPVTVCFILLMFGGLYLSGKGKLRPAYLVFWAACFLQPLFIPQPGVELYSMLRFILTFFPAFFLLGMLGKRHIIFHYLYLAFCFPMYGIFLTRFMQWQWVS